MRDELEPRHDDVALILSELVTNSVLHSKSASGEIDVDVQTQDGRIRLSVTDPGPCFDEKTSRSDGVGLVLIDRLSIDWGVDNQQGCTVWVELDRYRV